MNMMVDTYYNIDSGALSISYDPDQKRVFINIAGLMPGVDKKNIVKGTKVYDWKNATTFTLTNILKWVTQAIDVINGKITMTDVETYNTKDGKKSMVFGYKDGVYIFAVANNTKQNKYVSVDKFEATDIINNIKSFSENMFVLKYMKFLLNTDTITTSTKTETPTKTFNKNDKTVDLLDILNGDNKNVDSIVSETISDVDTTLI